MAILLEHRHFEHRGGAFGVPPDHDEAVHFDHMPGVDAGLGRNLLAAVGHRGAHALTVELPGVEGAAHILALNRSAVAQVGAQVGAVGVQDGDLSGLGAEHDHVAAKVLQRDDLLGEQLVGVTNLVPAERVGREAEAILRHGILHGRSTRVRAELERVLVYPRSGVVQVERAGPRGCAVLQWEGSRAVRARVHLPLQRLRGVR